MCTASWQWDEATCLVWFSRDERRTRPAALAPELYQNDTPHLCSSADSSSLLGAHSFLAPIDPQGKGTWIWLNQYGLAACLLNDYSASLPTQPSASAVQSRGKLMLELASSSSATSFEQNLQSLWQKNHYLGCHILLFTRETSPKHWHCKQGQIPQARTLSPMGMFTSSSWREAEVRQARTQRFKQLLPSSSKDKDKGFERLHRDRDPLGASWSILMDRDYSTTHSLTKLSLSAQTKATMRYQARLGNIQEFEPSMLTQAIDFAPAVSKELTI